MEDIVETDSSEGSHEGLIDDKRSCSNQPSKISTDFDEESTSEKPYRPPQCVIYAMCGAFITVILLDNIFIEIATINAPKGAIVKSMTPWLSGLSDWLDAMVRVCLGFYFVQSRRQILAFTKNLTWMQWFKIVSGRVLCQFGYVADVLAVTWLNGGTRTVISQVKVALVAMIRSYCFNDSPTSNQKYFIVVILFNALAWKADNLADALVNGENETFMIGFIVLIVSILVMGTFHVITESVLQNDLGKVPMWNKQFLFGLIDIPVQLCVLLLSIPIDNYLGLQRSWNLFQGFDVWCGLRVLNCNVWALASYCILAYCDATWLNILFVFAMIVLWPVELVLSSQWPHLVDEKFNITRVFVLFAISAACLGYEFENKKSKQN